MATLTVRNIQEKFYQRLRKSAAKHRRSISEEAIARLEVALFSNRVDPEDSLAQVRRLRAKMPRVFLNDRDLRIAKKQGRP
jgi:plasmid stability protein